MPLEPPPFQEAERCDVCKCSFNAFRRRHHCRCCGRTLCHEHSSNQMALPQFGVHSCVRVCSDCYNNSSWSGKNDQPVSTDAADRNDDLQTSSATVDVVTGRVSKLDIGADPELKTVSTAGHHPVAECTCGMPLCICEAPKSSRDTAPSQRITVSTFTAQLNPKPKRKVTSPKKRGSSSNSKLCSVFNLGQVTNSNLDGSQMGYEVNGEGVREAIKNNDTIAVETILKKGVDANYRDKQGLSLLHLAALFNQTDIAFVLMDYGASVDCKNSQGETPLDCAPATLQYKMREKIEKMSSTGHPT
ncbi:uncharacterized protein LOC131158394 [Malania oleifera]|uniref:uncharacterized protein LOC131158394 n=1 Tax=Malania oleifera TaxID=397392 RepID=UPI0025AE7F5F|nr:uncharacterized protein LOC131158394 [Malania oleifera]